MGQWLVATSGWLTGSMAHTLELQVMGKRDPKGSCSEDFPSYLLSFSPLAEQVILAW
jgi:hypothetical protein